MRTRFLAAIVIGILLLPAEAFAVEKLVAELTLRSHLRAVVNLQIVKEKTDGPPIPVIISPRKCKKDRDVLVQRRTTKGWKTVGEIETNAQGGGRTPLKDVQGTYRAKVKPGGLCGKLTSPSVLHRH